MEATGCCFVYAYVDAHIKIVPFSICIFQSGRRCIVSIILDIFPAFLALYPLTYMSLLLSLCIYVKSIRRNCICEHMTIFIQIVRLFINI